MDSQIHGAQARSALATGSGFSPFAERLLTALRSLQKDYQPHPCGGYNIDDMRWRMGLVFEPDENMHDAMDELINAKLIRFAGSDENAAYESCYAPCPNTKITNSGA